MYTYIHIYTHALYIYIYIYTRTMCIYTHVFPQGAGDSESPRAEVRAVVERRPGVRGPQGHGDHVGRNHVGRFTPSGCTGTLVQVHGSHH